MSKTSFSQNQQIRSRVKVYTKNFQGDSVILKADNDLVIPIVLTLNFKLNNLSSNSASQLKVSVPAKASGNVITVWKPTVANDTYKWSFSWSATLSDSSRYFDLKDYYLPFIQQNNIKLTQEPGGIFSHKGVLAYDFAMPVGTPILAARSGRVVLIKDDSALGGYDKKFLNQANYVCVYHTDGTVASYLHLNTKSTLVKEGQFVNQGQIIGYSGNTGYTDGPHLHFELLEAGSSKQEAIKWKTFSGDILSLKPSSDKWYKHLSRFFL